MNLVIGNTSQLSKYFPEDYVKIPSRNIDDEIFLKKWDSVYITFAKQNVFENTNENFIEINTHYTLDIINKLLDNCNKIVVYTTCEMFNNIYGPINIDIVPSFKPKFNNNYTNYILSKFLLNQIIKNNRKKDNRWEKVIIIHPFNFESVYKNKYFLFGKITNSILNKEKIEIYDIDFYKDLLHASRVVEESINAQTDCVIGSGQLINVKDTIKKIYNFFNMDYNDYVKELPSSNKKYNFYYSENKLNYSFFDDMVLDLKKLIYL
jgi:nucleoside-diphosphate-sugar epimerase